MAKMKLKNIILLSAVFVLLALGLFAVFKGTSQSAIGDFQSKAACEAYAKKSFCPSYDCTQCSSRNLGYTMQFSDGTKTSTVWTSDCKMKGTGTSSYNLCAPSITTTTTSTTTTSNGGLTELSAGNGNELCYPSGTVTTSYLCKAPVFTGATTYGCDINDLYKCSTTCDRSKNACATGTASLTTMGASVCGTACNQNGATRAVAQKPSAYEICKYFNSGCGLQWVGTYYCPTGQFYIAGSCQKGYDCGELDAGWTCDYLTGDAYTSQSSSQSCSGSTCPKNATSGTNVVGQTCAIKFTCTDATHIKATARDCTTKTYTCGTGKECQSGNCVSTAPVITTTPVTTITDSQITTTAATTDGSTVNICEGVSCPDNCDEAYTSYEQGTCDATIGQCKFENIQTMSANCLPVAKSNATGSITGNVVVDTTRTSTEETAFEKYGVYVGLGVFVALIVAYFLIDEKKGKKRKWN